MLASLIYFVYIVLLNLFLLFLGKCCWEYIKTFVYFLEQYIWKIWILVWGLVLQYILFFLLIFLLLKKFLNIDIIQFFKNQFKWKWLWYFFIFGIWWYFLVMLLMGLIRYITLKLWIQIPGSFWEEKVLTFVEDIVKKWNFYVKFLLFFVVVFVWPIIEELIYRWFITKLLLEWKNSLLSLVLSAFIFAFVHFEWAVFRNLFVISLWLAYVYRKTRSLWYTVLIHIMINGLTFLYIISQTI